MNIHEYSGKECEGTVRVTVQKADIAPEVFLRMVLDGGAFAP